MSQQVVVYPNAVTRATSSHSNGSFGPVLIVLAVIAAVSLASCVIGRLCSRRSYSESQKNKQQLNQDVGTKEWDWKPKPILKVRPNEDLESGLATKIPGENATGSGGEKAAAQPPPQIQRPHIRFVERA